MKSSDWSRNSEKWNSENKKLLNYSVEEKEFNFKYFYISFEEFFKYWRELIVIKLFDKIGSSNDDCKWKCKCFSDEFHSLNSYMFTEDEGKSINNPQFVLKLEEKTNIFLSLKQRDFRFTNIEKENKCVFFYVFKSNMDYDENHPEITDRLSPFG